MSKKPKTFANRKKNKKVHLWWVPSSTVCSKKRKYNQPENKKKKSHGNKINGEANRGNNNLPPLLPWASSGCLSGVQWLPWVPELCHCKKKINGN